MECEGGDSFRVDGRAVIDRASGHDSSNFRRAYPIGAGLGTRRLFAEVQHRQASPVAAAVAQSTLRANISQTRTHSVVVFSFRHLGSHQIALGAPAAHTKTPELRPSPPDMATKAKAAAPLVQQYISSQKIGVVVSAGKMSRAVKVRVAEQEWNKQFRKHFLSPKHYTVSDPNSSLVEGDVVRITSGHRTSATIRHVVTSIVAPFGEPVENRPPVLSQQQLDELRTQERLLKDVRSAGRGRQTSVQRLLHAEKRGFKIPTLEEAQAKLKAHEELARVQREKDGKQAHKGQAGQLATGRQRKVQGGVKSKADKQAEEKVKIARKQTA
jgi:small subunit ribosomal protein S17